MDAKRKFAENLAYYMQLRGLTRRDIATMIDVSYYTVTDWCNGRKFPRIDKLQALATFLKCEKSDLLERKIDPEISEDKANLIQYVQQVPDDKAKMILQVIRSVLESA